MSPPTEATALENNKHCRNTQWLLARLRALLSQGKHSSPAEPARSCPVQILKLHGLDTLGKIWTIFSLSAASTSSLGYIYWILQATIHILRLNQCSFTTQIFTSVSPTGNIFCLQEPLNKSVFLTMIVQTLLIRVNYTHRF